MIFLLILFLSALYISSVAAWFSIAGLIAIFPGSVLAVGLMGAALELGKLVSASWLYRFWNKAHLMMRIYFITAIMILSFVTSIGIFGYLSRSHIEGSQGLSANTEQIALLDDQIATETQTIDFQKKALQQMDAAVNNLVAKDATTERAVSVRNSQKKERATASATITESNAKILQLKQQKSTLNVGQRKLETEIGPIKYVAQLVYGTDDTTTVNKATRLLIFLLIFVFDPLAILMVVAANMQMREMGKDTPVKVPKTDHWASASIVEVDEDANVREMPDDWEPNNWFTVVQKPK